MAAPQSEWEEERGESRPTRGWRLAKGAWRLTRRDPTLVPLALLGAVFVAIAAAANIRIRWELTQGGGEGVLDTLLALPGLYLTILLTNYFCVALAAAADAGFERNPMSVREALLEARERLRPIALWSLLAAAVGLALGEAGGRGSGSTVATFWLVAVPWTFATAFVVPIIALNGAGPGEALLDSARTARSRWAEEIAGMLSIGLFWMLAAFGGGLVIAIAAGAHSSHAALAIVAIVIGVLGLVFVALMLAATAQAFTVALYRLEAGIGLGGAALAGMDFSRGPNAGRKRTVARVGFAVLGVVVVLTAFGVLMPKPQTTRSEAEAGYFHMSYPASYRVDLGPGSPVVYQDQQVGVVLGSEFDGSQVVVAFRADPRLCSLILGKPMSFGRFHGHFYLRIGPAPQPGANSASPI